jgi:uncharacterized protein YfaT (DUF1175 family)
VRAVSFEDADQDGLPDAAELWSHEDRNNFRRWFTAIAEQQFYKPSDAWNTEQRDCAGLVRFSCREALRHHDRAWFKALDLTDGAFGIPAPDVKAFSLESGILGEKLFRTDFGTFHKEDLETRFSEYADARSLKNFNTRFISRNRQEARAGDLLFFYQPWVQRSPYHVMIFLGEARFGDTGDKDWVVYHTGSSASDEGTIKKVRLAVLDGHPDKRWRPVQQNPNFLGFYRLKLLGSQEY